MVCGVFGPTIQEWVVPGLVRNTHHRGFARPTSGMLPSTAVDGCMDRVLVDFPVSGHITRGFFPDSVSEEDARVSTFVPLVCCMPRPKFVPQFAGASPRCMVVDRRYVCVCLCPSSVELRIPVCMREEGSRAFGCTG